VIVPFLEKADPGMNLLSHPKDVVSRIQPKNIKYRKLTSTVPGTRRYFEAITRQITQAKLTLIHIVDTPERWLAPLR
jgi:hypothetical protein